MSATIKSIIVLFITALLITGCASSPEPVKHDPYNDADSQRSRAKQTQDELSRETSK